MEEINRILRLSLDAPRLITALQELRQHADGCRLQGGEDQLEKAMGLFAGLQSYEKAEECILQAMLNAGSGHGDYGMELLHMANSLVKRVYFAAADQSLLSAPAVSAADWGEGGWLHKAWHVLRWSLSRVAGPPPAALTESSPALLPFSLLDLDSSPLNDQAVHSLYALLWSSDFLQRYAGDSMCEGWRHEVVKGLKLLSHTLQKLCRHALAVEMSLLVLSNVDRVDRELAVFLPVRWVCIRSVLSYCEALCNNSTNTSSRLSSSTGVKISAAGPSALLDSACTHLPLLGNNRMVFEMWGDVCRMRGGNSHKALALCLYAACFDSTGMSMNRDTKRLADKIQAMGL
ncbi:hypothetical protein EON64_20835, partial [archaeon]